MIICTTDPGARVPDGFSPKDLRGYIEHKTGEDIESTIADSPERFRVIESEALRDLVVMSEIEGTDIYITLLPGTPENPACTRLLKDYCVLQ